VSSSSLLSVAVLRSTAACSNFPHRPVRYIGDDPRFHEFPIAVRDADRETVADKRAPSIVIEEFRRRIERVQKLREFCEVTVCVARFEGGENLFGEFVCRGGGGLCVRAEPLEGLKDGGVQPSRCIGFKKPKDERG
jgi:hypothetical protein